MRKSVHCNHNWFRNISIHSDQGKRAIWHFLHCESALILVSTKRIPILWVIPSRATFCVCGFEAVFHGRLSEFDWNQSWKHQINYAKYSVLQRLQQRSQICRRRRRWDNEYLYEYNRHMQLIDNICLIQAQIQCEIHKTNSSYGIDTNEAINKPFQAWYCL